MVIGMAMEARMVAVVAVIRMGALGALETLVAR